MKHNLSARQVWACVFVVCLFTAKYSGHVEKYKFYDIESAVK